MQFGLTDVVKDGERAAQALPPAAMSELEGEFRAILEIRLGWGLRELFAQHPEECAALAAGKLRPALTAAAETLLRREDFSQFEELLVVALPPGGRISLAPDVLHDALFRQFRRDAMIAARHFRFIEERLEPEPLLQLKRKFCEQCVNSLREGRSSWAAFMLEHFALGEAFREPAGKSLAEEAALQFIVEGKTDSARWVLSACRINPQKLLPRAIALLMQTVEDPAVPGLRLLDAARALTRVCGHPETGAGRDLALAIARRAVTENRDDGGARCLERLSGHFQHFDVPPAMYRSAEFQLPGARLGVRAAARRGESGWVENAASLFGCDPACISRAVQEEAKAALARKDHAFLRALFTWYPQEVTPVAAAAERPAAAALGTALLESGEIEAFESFVRGARLSFNDFDSREFHVALEPFLIRALGCRCGQCGEGFRRVEKALGRAKRPLSEALLGLIEDALQRDDMQRAARLAQYLSRDGNGLQDSQAVDLVVRTLMDCVQNGDTRRIKTLQSLFHIPPKSFQQPQLADVCVARICRSLAEGQIEHAGEVQRLGAFRDQQIESAARNIVEASILQGDIERLNRLAREITFEGRALAQQGGQALLAGIARDGWPGQEQFDVLRSCFRLPARLFRGAQARECALLGLDSALRHSNIIHAAEIQRQFRLPAERSSRERLLAALQEGFEDFPVAACADFMRAFRIDHVDGGQHPELRRSAYGALRGAIRDNDLESAALLQKAFQFAPVECAADLAADIAHVTNHHRAVGGLAMSQTLGFDTRIPIDAVAADLSDYYRAIALGCGLSTLEDLFHFVPAQQEYCNWLARESATCVLTPAVYSLLRKPKDHNGEGLPLTLFEADRLIRHRHPILEFARAGDMRGLYRALNSIYCKEESLAELDRIGAQWGYQRTLEYLYRPNGIPVDNRTECLRALRRLELLSGRQQDVLESSILAHVQRDGASYDGKCPQFELARILSQTNFSPDWSDGLDQTFGAVEPLANSLLSFSDGRRSAFRSWEDLKQFSKLQSAARDPEFLRTLAMLRETDPALYDFCCAIYFHEASRADGEAVRQFVFHPAVFVARSDRHIHPALHKSIKPSGYVDRTLPYLDLTAEELRGALVGGVLDRLQAFQPLQIRYHLPKSCRFYPTVHEAFLAAVGKRSQGIEGQARSAGRLFKIVSQRLQEQGVDPTEYARGAAGLSPELEAWVLEQVYHKEFGIPEEWVAATATLHAKSDPLAVIVGDDTACCMPFGEGKNNNYMFDPNTMLFTVQVERSDGVLRTVAQSVLTRDVDIGKSFFHIVQAVKTKAATDIAALLDAPPQMSGPFVLSCDNLQMAPNAASSAFHCEITRRVYTDFFQEYMARFGSAGRLDPAFAGIGQGSSSAIEPLPGMANNYMPLTYPIGYCDRNDGEVRRLSLENPSGLLRREVRVLEREDRRSSLLLDPAAPAGVSTLQLTDTAAAAYVQGRACRQQPERIRGIQKMRTSLIAVAIHDLAKGTPQLGVKYTEPDGTVTGYLVAYQGLHGREPIVHLQEMACCSQNPLAAWRMLGEFARRYAAAFNSRTVLPAILVGAGDVNGERLVHAALRRVSARLGLDFIVEPVSAAPPAPKTLHIRVAKRR